ncbi:MAG: hypothetical protein PHH14_02020 [Candidatus Margulisbacteria bacterium]|nr:hypothetical protein [Candidatus Margulisiibacteriota bacterium]
MIQALILNAAVGFSCAREKSEDERINNSLKNLKSQNERVREHAVVELSMFIGNGSVIPTERTTEIIKALFDAYKTEKNRTGIVTSQVINALVAIAKARPRPMISNHNSHFSVESCLQKAEDQIVEGFLRFYASNDAQEKFSARHALGGLLETTGTEISGANRGKIRAAFDLEGKKQEPANINNAQGNEIVRAMPPQNEEIVVNDTNAIYRLQIGKTYIINLSGMPLDASQGMTFDIVGKYSNFGKYTSGQIYSMFKIDEINRIVRNGREQLIGFRLRVTDKAEKGHYALTNSSYGTILTERLLADTVTLEVK